MGSFFKLLSIFWIGRAFLKKKKKNYKGVGRYFNVKVGIYLGVTFYSVALFLLFLSIHYFNPLSFVLG